MAQRRRRGKRSQKRALPWGAQRGVPRVLWARPYAVLNYHDDIATRSHTAEQPELDG